MRCQELFTNEAKIRSKAAPLASVVHFANDVDDKFTFLLFLLTKAS